MQETRRSHQDSPSRLRRFAFAGLACLLWLLAGLGQASAANILWVSDNGPLGFSGPGSGFSDSGFVTLLQSAGHNVNRYNGPDSQNTVLSAADLAAINTNDLILLGRSVGSGQFQAPQATNWNVHVTKPILSINAYLARTTRLGWFAPGSENDDSPTRVTALNLNDPETDWIFLDAAMNGNTTVEPYDEWWDRNTSQLPNAFPTNGTRLATATYAAQGNAALSTATIIAEWPAGALVRTNNLLGGYRMYFAAASRELDGQAVSTAGVENLSSTGEKMFLRAVQIALNNGVAPFPPDWPVGFKQQPANVTAFENATAVFSVLVTGTPPRTVQWQRDDGAGGFTNIPGATALTYTLGPVKAGDHNAQFRALANNFTSATSEAATLTVETDLAGPMVTGVRAWPFFTNVLVTFSEPVETTDATDEANYTLGGSNPTSATLDAAGTKVVLILPPNIAALAADTAYVLTIGNIRDRAAAQTRMTETNVTFKTPALVSGYLRADYYENIGTGGNVADLTNNAKYPLWHDNTRYLTRFESPINYADAYGLRVWGFFVPPTNGHYTFYLRSDDRSTLLMNTNAVDSENPAGAVPIAWANGANTGWSTNVNQRTNLLLLTAGQRYYLEALLKEGTGGDYFRVLVRGAEPPGVPAIPADGDTGAASGQFFAGYLDTDGAAVTFAPAPQSVSVPENRTATFSAGVTTTPAHLLGLAALQWQRSDGSGGFTNIPGATTTRYTTSPLGVGDDQAQFKLLVQVPGLLLQESAVATLTVTEDLAPPLVVSVGSVDGLTVGVCFDELLDQTGGTATDSANYYVNGENPSAVSLRPDGRSVILTLIAPITGAFTVRTVDVQDVKGNGAGYSSPEIAGQVMGLSGQDLGFPLAAGSQYTCSSNALEVVAGGADIGGTADEGRLVSRPIRGDFDARVRVDSLTMATLTGGGNIAEAGLMLRASLADSGSPNLHLLANPPAPGRAQIDAGRRNVSAETTRVWGTAVPGVGTSNLWLRLTRSGDRYAGYRSSDGATWFQFASGLQATMPADALLGMAVSCHTNLGGLLVTSTFSGFSHTQPIADLAITQTDAPDPVLVGGNVTYTINVTSVGPDAANKVTVTDTLPAGVTFVSATASVGSCAHAAGVVTCTLDTLAAGASAIITLVVRTTVTGPAENVANVTSFAVDPNLANSTSTATTVVCTQPQFNLGSLVYSGEAGGSFTGTLQTVAGLSYVVEYKDALSDAMWTELTTIVGDGTVKSFTDPGPLPATRFYRIRVVAP